ncbi:hypothetical protein BDV25DRAFT_155142 [Aspergillus avenaceus]|uniref:Uncharacterized protein n=1 Tax=Aspergillus avenaceus TaxID=36643 RepID=A0A5N6TUV1_ASPAV|nr:hypothetical protein BDV25DRAFT_155142 [Aspergillus avenaceus]
MIWFPSICMAMQLELLLRNLVTWRSTLWIASCLVYWGWTETRNLEMAHWWSRL